MKIDTVEKMGNNIYVRIAGVNIQHLNVWVAQIYSNALAGMIALGVYEYTQITNRRET
jgi:hypothetical protein